MKVRKILGGVCVFALSLVLWAAMGVTATFGAPAVTIEAAGGGVSGTWYSVLAALAEIVNKQDKGVIMKVVPGGGLTNPAIIGSGQVDCGWIYASFGLAAREGTEPYNEKYQDLYGVVSNFNPMSLEISVMKESGITDFKEALTGAKPARILTGVKSTSTGWYFDRVLEYYGTSASEISQKGGSVIYTNYGDWPQMATDGHVDLMFNHIGIPSSTLREILTYREVVLLPWPDDLAKFMSEKYSLKEGIIKAGSYPFLKEDVKTLISPTVLAVNKNVPDEAVYAILEIIEENIDNVRALHPSIAEFELNDAWTSTGVPLHPGAEKFYKDKGYMK